jgi:hypothetical protein
MQHICFCRVYFLLVGEFPVLFCPVLSCLVYRPYWPWSMLSSQLAGSPGFRYCIVQPIFQSCPVLFYPVLSTAPTGHGPSETLNWLDLQAPGIVLFSPFSSPVLSCPVLSCSTLSTSPTGHGPFEALKDLQASGIVLFSPLIQSCPVLSCPVQPIFQSCPVLSCLSPLLGPCETIKWLDLLASGILLSSPSSCPVLSCPVLSCLVSCLS